jgi:hypothetical protein
LNVWVLAVGGVPPVEIIVLDVAFISIPVPAVRKVIAPAVSFHPRTALAFGSARLAPVPPSARAKSVMPVMEPPVILTAFAFCVAIVPRPSVVRWAEASASSISAAPATETVTFEAEISSVLFDAAPVVNVSTVLAVRFEPTAIVITFEASASLIEMPEAFATIVPPVIATALAFCVPSVPTPRLVLAVAASDAPVPPSATARSVMPVIDPPVIATAFAFCVEIVPRPSVVR